MLVLCLNYATIQGGTPPPHFTLSSLDQWGHCRKAEYSKFLMQSGLIACMPFCFISVYKSRSGWDVLSPSEHDCLLLSTAYSHADKLFNPPVISHTEQRQTASKQVYKSKPSSGNYTIFGADKVLFIEYKQSWEGPDQFFLLVSSFSRFNKSPFPVAKALNTVHTNLRFHKVYIKTYILPVLSVLPKIKHVIF